MAFLVCAAACGQRTEIVVGIATDIAVPTKLDRVRLRVEDDQGSVLLARDWAAGADLKLPGSVGIGPTSSSLTNGGILVSIEGVKSLGPAPDGSELTETHIIRQSRLSFVAGKTLFLRMTLRGACYDQLAGACPMGQWCEEGVCRPIDVDPNTLPSYNPGDETIAQCGTASDALSLALTPPTSPSCAAGLTCIEESCVAGGIADGPAPAIGDGSSAPADLALDAAPPLIDAAPPDLAVVDVASSDTATRPPDLAPPPPPDLVPPIDLTYLADFTGVTLDLVPPPDLAMPDLAQPDLSVPDLLLPDLAHPDLLPGGPTTYPPFTTVTSNDPATAGFYDGSNASGSTLWAAVGGGGVEHLVNGAFTVESTGASFPLTALVIEGSDVWAIGQGVGVAHRASNGAWTLLPIPGGYDIPYLSGLAGDGKSGVVAIGNLTYSTYHNTPGDPVILRADGTSGVSVRDGLDLGKITATTPDPIFFTLTGVATAGTSCGMLVGTVYDAYAQKNLGSFVANYDASTHAWTALAPFAAAGGIFTEVVGCGSGALLLGTNAAGAPVAMLYNGSAWSAASVSGLGVTTGDVVSPVAVGADVYAFARDAQSPSNGSVVHWNGAAWSRVSTSFTVPAGALPVLTAGKDSGGTLRIDVLVGATLYTQQTNGSWSATQPPTPAHLDGKPWGDGKGLLVAPSGGGIWYTTDDTNPTKAWTAASVSAGKTLTAITQVTAVATSGGKYKYFASADQGVILSSTDLTAGFTAEYTSAGGESFAGVWAADVNNVYAVGASSSTAVVATNQSGSWKTSTVTLPYSQNTASTQSALTAVYGFSSSEIYVGGYAYFTNGSSMLGHAVVFAGNGTAFSDAQLPATIISCSDSNNVGCTPTSSTVTGIWGASSGDVWAVARSGQMFRRQGGTWSAFPSPAFLQQKYIGTALAAIHGASASRVFTAGASGTVYAWDGGGWVQVTTGSSALLDGVWVDPKDVWVGGGDTVLELGQ